MLSTIVYLVVICVFSLEKMSIYGPLLKFKIRLFIIIVWLWDARERVESLLDVVNYGRLECCLVVPKAQTKI